MAVTLIRGGRRSGMTTLTRLVSILKSKTPDIDDRVAVAEAMVEMGLSPAWRPYPALAPIYRPHFEPGDKVEVLSPGAARFKCKKGDTGVVVKMCPAGGMFSVVPDDDLYFVDLDVKASDNARVYLTYKELKKA